MAFSLFLAKTTFSKPETANSFSHRNGEIFSFSKTETPYVDFVEKCNAESTANFLVIIHNLIFSPLIQIIIFKKKSLVFKQILLS